MLTHPARGQAAARAAASSPLMSRAQSYLFDLNGFLHIKSALSAAEVARLSAALDLHEQEAAALAVGETVIF